MEISVLLKSEFHCAIFKHTENGIVPTTKEIIDSHFVTFGSFMFQFWMLVYECISVCHCIVHRFFCSTKNKNDKTIYWRLLLNKLYVHEHMCVYVIKYQNVNKNGWTTNKKKSNIHSKRRCVQRFALYVFFFVSFSSSINFIQNMHFEIFNRNYK